MSALKQEEPLEKEDHHRSNQDKDQSMCCVSSDKIIMMEEIRETE